jgi:hypothetical protein
VEPFTSGIAGVLTPVVALLFVKGWFGGSSAGDGVPVLDADKVVQPWGAPS